MIEALGLTKKYGSMTAVDQISFEIDAREVVGFLGPNGAGKTTTMKMLSCFMPATSGSAKVAGYDVVRESLKVRQNIGYLPENVPLPHEMKVEEYLQYRARLKGISRADRKTRLSEAMDRCGVAHVRKKAIGALSKGYRQRVGLADALVANPPILILDEPTEGLDPEQILQVRGLIQELGRDHTILLSTHILPEVEKICQRVIVISSGTIRAMDTLTNLKKGSGVLVEIQGETEAAVAEALTNVDGVTDLKVVPSEGEEGSRYFLHTEKSQAVREQVYRLAVSKAWVLLGLSDESRRLEDIYIEIVTADRTLAPTAVTDLLSPGSEGASSHA